MLRGYHERVLLAYHYQTIDLPKHWRVVMSMMWGFYSYSQARFDAFFGGGEPNAAQQILDALASAHGDDDEEDEDDEDGDEEDDAPCTSAESLKWADRITRHGISREDVQGMDDVFQSLFSPDGLWEQLEMESESPDGLHPSVVAEMQQFADAESFSLLTVLDGGRRYGETDDADCDYCFLSVAECEQLLSGVRQILAKGGPWSDRWMPKVIEECLAGPLQAAVSKKRPLFGTLG